MLTKPILRLVLAGVAAGVLGAPVPARACAFLDRLFGRSPGVSVAQTTYAPPFQGPVAVSSVPAVRVARPVTVCSPPMTACPTVQTCQYVAETRLEPRPRPILTALFGPRVEQQVDPCTGCTVTTYRPRTGLFPQLAPTTTYRMVCSPTMTPAVAYSPVVTYAPASHTIPQPSHFGVPGCPTGGCGPPPALPPAVPPAHTQVAPGPAPYTGPEAGTITPRTFAPQQEQRDRRPEPEQQESLPPLPDGNTKLERTPAPLLVDPSNRTTSHPGKNMGQAATVAVRHAVYQPETDTRRPAKLVEVQWKPASR